ncbi:MAG TPA: hypothetical protein VHF89_02070, partial [Solirubrobacteraceae bacterium]|nr:hypothetical protein [Solirubrobacteraceae bacterium]
MHDADVKLAKRKKQRAAAKRCRVVRDKRTGRRKKACRKTRRRPVAAPVPRPLPQLPVPSAAAPPATAPPAPAAPPPAYVAVE